MQMEKTPYAATRKKATHNLLTKLPGVIGQAKNVKGVLKTWNKLFDDMLEMIITYTNQFIEHIKTNYE